MSLYEEKHKELHRKHQAALQTLAFWFLSLVADLTTWDTRYDMYTDTFPVCSPSLTHPLQPHFRLTGMNPQSTIGVLSGRAWVCYPAFSKPPSSPSLPSSSAPVWSVLDDQEWQKQQVRCDHLQPVPSTRCSAQRR